MDSRDDNEIFRALRRHDVNYVIIGGHAVNFHGYTRLTEDVDIVWMRSEDAEPKLLAALAEIDGKYIGNEIDPATGVERSYSVSLPYIRSTPLMVLVTRFGFLDLFDYVPGLPDEDVGTLFASSVDSNGLRYASLEWLRRMKEAAGRTKDRLDLENLPD